MTSRARSQHNTLSVLAITALALIFFAPLFIGRTFSTVAGHQNSVYPWRATPTKFPDCSQNDQADLSYPWQCFITQSFREGEFPFWNPYSFGGQPFFANGSSAVLYPPKLLLSLLTTPSWTHDLLSVLHLLGSGLAMYFLLRGYGCGARGSLFAAVTWMFSGFNLSWLQLEVVAPVFLFLPLNLLAVRAALRRETLASCFLASAIMASCLAAGHLPFMGITCVVAMAYAGVASLIRAVRLAKTSDWRGVTRTIAVTAGLAVLPGLLAAIVLLPTMMAVGASQRGMPGYEGHNVLNRAAASIFFRLFRVPNAPPDVTAMHTITFMGFAAIPFVLIGVVLGIRRRIAGTWLALSIAAVVFLVATDILLLRVAYKVIPGMGTFRPLSRLLYLYNFALAMLAGIGLDAFLRWLERPDQKAARVIVQRWKAVVLIAILASTFHLVRYGRKLNPKFSPRTDELLYPVTPLLDAAQKELASEPTSPGRVLPLLVYPPDMPWPPPILFGSESMVFSIESISGYDSVIPRRALALCRIAAGETAEQVLANPDIGSICPFYKLRETRFDLLPRFGVNLLLGPPQLGADPIWKERRSELALENVYEGKDGIVLRMTNAIPGPRVVHRAVAAKDEADALRQFTAREFDYREAVVIESESPLPANDAGGSVTGQPGQVLKVTKRRNQWSAKVTSASPGWLVIPDTWSPGWRAQVNGAPAELHRANYAFRAVRVPAGESEVRMEYHPEGFKTGATISGGTALALALGMFLVGRRQRAAPAAPQD